MHDLVFVVRRGPLKNLTLQSIKFEYFGCVTNLPIIECNEFAEGFVSALNYKYAMFVDSGTVFLNVLEFLEDLKTYPHQGLIGHIIDPKNINKPFYLHPQAFLLELAKFDVTDFDDSTFLTYAANRSQDNIHDDYTPWWIKSTKETKDYPNGYFGAKLIARQLSEDRLVVNFKQILRKNKLYLYRLELVADYLTTQEDYCRVAENQLWIFNNETYTINRVRELTTPASGLFWIFHALLLPRQINLVDISQVQLDFAMELWLKWDGVNYGKFVSNYIKEHKIIHYLIDNQPRTKLEQLQLLKPSVFVDTVNKMFDKECVEHNITDFTNRWLTARQRVTVLFHNQDMVKYCQKNNPKVVWMSNILDYKYTMLKNYD
jgi:hypothetical protein